MYWMELVRTKTATGTYIQKMTWISNGRQYVEYKTIMFMRKCSCPRCQRIADEMEKHNAKLTEENKYD